ENKTAPGDLSAINPNFTPEPSLLGFAEPWAGAELPDAGDAQLNRRVLSYGPNDTVYFKLRGKDSAGNAVQFNLDIYRLGYYEGAGARHIFHTSETASASAPNCGEIEAQMDPKCAGITEANTKTTSICKPIKEIECHWSKTVEWPVGNSFTGL